MILEILGNNVKKGDVVTAIQSPNGSYYYEITPRYAVEDAVETIDGPYFKFQYCKNGFKTLSMWTHGRLVRVERSSVNITQAFLVWWFSSPKHISWSFDSVDTSTYFQSYSIPLTEQDKLILKSSLNCMKFNDAGWDEARRNLSKRLSKVLSI